MAGTSFLRLLASYCQWYLASDKFLVGGNVIKVADSWTATIFFTDHSGQFPGTHTVSQAELEEWESAQADSYEDSMLLF